MKIINRRTILRGAGGLALGLPWLEAMGQSSLNVKNVRLGYLYFANGVIAEHWVPKGRGSDMTLSKTLMPLKPIQDMVNVHSNLTHDTHCGHQAGGANFLSGATVGKGLGGFKVAKSADQVAAEYLGSHTAFPSIELSTRISKRSGLNNQGYMKSIGDYISWINETTPAPRETIPANAYARLFKGSSKKSSTPEETKSILDYVKDDVVSMKRYLGKEDQYRINQYFSSVRALERRIQKLSQDNFSLPRNAKKPKDGVPANFKDHVELMLDIIVLAFQTNRTKIASFMFTPPNGNNINYNFLGVNGNHHTLSHHNNNPRKMKDCETITRFYISMYSRFLQKLHAIKEGDKSLLDNSLILMGAALWDGNKHTHKQKPILLAGKGGGSVKTGLHQIHSKGKPFNNLLLGMMQTAGCPLRKFGDSRGSIV